MDVISHGIELVHPGGLAAGTMLEEAQYVHPKAPRLQWALPNPGRASGRQRTRTAWRGSLSVIVGTLTGSHAAPP